MLTGLVLIVVLTVRRALSSCTLLLLQVWLTEPKP